LMFKWILDYGDGLLNAALFQIGIGKVEWLGNPVLANVSLILVDTWRGSPYAMVLLLAGLQAVPAELFEAAAADGASAWRAFWSITVPLLRIPLLIVLVLLTIINFNVVVAQLVLTGGGPGRATEPLSLEMYSQAFTYFRMGSAASIAVFILALNLVLAGVYTRLLRSEEGR
jgi:multiple sugar transport system permease protein